MRRRRRTPAGQIHGPFVRNPKAPSSLFESVLDLAYAGTHPNTPYANDGSGRNNNGILTGYTNPSTEGWEYSEFLGRWGNLFDGSANWIAGHPVQQPPPQSLSVFAWINNAAITGDRNTIATVWKTGGNNRLFYISVENDRKLRCRVFNDGLALTLKSYLSIDTLDLAQWYHVGFTFANNALLVYINGTEASVNKENDDNVTTLKSDGIYTLSANEAPLHFHSGQIADPLIYPFALTQPLIEWLADRTNRLYIPDTRRVFYAPLVTGWLPWLRTRQRHRLGA